MFTYTCFESHMDEHEKLKNESQLLECSVRISCETGIIQCNHSPSAHTHKINNCNLIDSNKYHRKINKKNGFFIFITSSTDRDTHTQLSVDENEMNILIALFISDDNNFGFIYYVLLRCLTIQYDLIFDFSKMINNDQSFVDTLNG